MLGKSDSIATIAECYKKTESWGGFGQIQNVNESHSNFKRNRRNCDYYK